MSLGVFLPPRALVIHRVLQAVPVFVTGGPIARVPDRVPRAPVLVQVLENGQLSMIGCVRARPCIPSTVVLSHPLQQPYTPLYSSVAAYVVPHFTKKSNDSLVGQRQSFVVVQQAYEMSSPLPRTVVMCGNASKSNLRGYAAEGLEASLHNLLTSARLWRVLTHCTWEKTTVAISKCGSKVGRYASSTCLPFLSCMVAVRGEE